MIISVQRQFLLAAAIVLSLTVTQSPLAAFGQSTNTAPPTGATTDGNQAAAQQMLLKARQALAHGDVDSATAMLQSARQAKVDFKKIGDSPETVESMIQRQGQLIDLANAKDASYDSGAAAFLLIQAEAMIYYQDFETAEMLINQAKMFPVEFTPAIGSPEKLTQMLATAKQSAAGKSTVTGATAKAEVLKLLSRAQLAMDQENWNVANSLVEQAKKQNVPDSQFAANEPRPWQLELKIQNALNRQSFANGNPSGNQTTPANAQTFDPAVMRTSFEESTAQLKNVAQSPPLNTSQVVQAGYDPANDSTENVQVAAKSEIEATPAVDTEKMDRIPSSGLDFYNSGLKALTVNDQAAAIAYFQKAWENRQDLDGRTRQAIKDQIERLVPGRSATILKATLASQEADIDINEIKTDQRTAFTKLQSDVFRERTAAERLLETKPREALEKMSMVRGRIAQSSLDSASQRPLLAMIDRDINEMQKYIEQNLPDIMNEEQNATNLDKVDRDRQRKLDVEQQLQKLVDDYNHLIDEKRFPEAGVVVNQASDLAPDSELVVLLREKHRIHANLERAMAIKAMKQEALVDSLAATEEAAIAWDYSHDVEFGNLEKYSKNADRRLAAQNANRYSSPAEERIWNTLKTERVQGQYRGTLAEAVNQLSQQAGVNIIFDDLALTAEGIKKDTLIDVPINNPISLNSALDIILGNAGLVFVVESEVIKITSKEARSNNLVTRTYYIGDLVMPMNQNPNPLQLNYQYPGMNSQPGMQRGMNGSFNAVDANSAQSGGTSQLAMAQQMAGNNLPGNPFNGLAMGGYNGGQGGPQTGIPITQKIGGQGFGGVSMQDFFPLIQLVQNTIQTDTWQQTGGVGTIQPYPANLSLIVSQTQEIQDEIQDLLKKLRELNDVQIVIEVRFITLSDNFFEKIGIDFDFNINDNSGLTPLQATADNISGSRVVGRDVQDGAGFVPTSDLDLKFLNGSFGAAQTAIGGFNQASAGSFGFAILSDIEVFFLIQASKGDRRSSIMQAPTVTMFNGQSANVSDGAQRPFVTSVIPVVGDFAVAHQPVITILPDGTNLDVQAVVSDDRRFVRMNLVPFFSQVTDVETFTFDGSTTTQRSTNSVLDDLLDAVNPATADSSNDELETVKQGITIQLPVLSFTTVNTVVSVPDGGTVLMGGIKRMSEARAENGIPFLSNIPYVNRLFKNTAIGHETSNLMMMVTPRIIIQKEIEEDQVGLIGG